MKTLRWFCLFLALIALTISGCQKATEAPKDKDRLYDIKAKVVEVDSDKKTVTLDHEDIPGLMKGMQMKFPVESAKTLEGLKAGDEVQGKLRVSSGDYLITELHKK